MTFGFSQLLAGFPLTSALQPFASTLAALSGAGPLGGLQNELGGFPIQDQVAGAPPVNPTLLPVTAPDGPISVDQVLSPYVIVFCVAFVVAYIFTPIMRHVAIAYGIVDNPDRARKIHRRPVAYLGGVAVFVGFVAALAISQFVELHNVPGVARAKSDGLIASAASYLVRVPPGLAAAACVVVALGLLDDIRGVSPRIKIVGQIAAAGTLLASGFGLTLVLPALQWAADTLHVQFGLQVPLNAVMWTNYVLSAALTVGIVVFCCNASNLMDGLDGLCGGVTAIIAIGFVFLAVHLAMTGPDERIPRDALRVVVALSLFGAVLGFLPFNFNPASIFMGDAGSLFLGFTIATLIILVGEINVKWLLAGLVMFSLPVLDTALAFARRWVNKRPFFSADRQHFHHQLVARGLSVRRAVLLSYGLTIFFVAAGCLIIFLRTRYANAFYLVLFGCIIVAAYKVGMVHERPLNAAEGDLDEIEDDGSTAASVPGTDSDKAAA